MTVELWALVFAAVWAVNRFVRNVRAAQERIDWLLADFDQRYPRDDDSTMSSR